MNELNRKRYGHRWSQWSKNLVHIPCRGRGEYHSSIRPRTLLHSDSRLFRIHFAPSILSWSSPCAQEMCLSWHGLGASISGVLLKFCKALTGRESLGILPCKSMCCLQPGLRWVETAQIAKKPSSACLRPASFGFGKAQVLLASLFLAPMLLLWASEELGGKLGQDQAQISNPTFQTDGLNKAPRSAQTFGPRSHLNSRPEGRSEPSREGGKAASEPFESF